MDKLTQSLGHRLEAYRHLCSLFSVLFCESNASVIENATVLASAHPSDLDDSLGDELIQLRSFIKPEDDTSPKGLLRKILDCGLQSMFPNVYVALRLFLTLPVCNCEGERSFSVLSRIKNELRTKMTQKLLKALSLMAIESELTKALDFDDVVDDFARSRARKKSGLFLTLSSLSSLLASALQLLGLAAAPVIPSSPAAIFALLHIHNADLLSSGIVVPYRLFC